MIHDIMPRHFNSSTKFIVIYRFYLFIILFNSGKHPKGASVNNTTSPWFSKKFSA